MPDSIMQIETDCCGCTSCYSVCPVSAIEMKENSEGFLHPKINQDKCINCFKCNQVCPVLNYEKTKKSILKVYSVKNKNPDVLEHSQSGGAFFSLASYILSCGGIVYGCVIGKDLSVYHTRAATFDELDRMHGSKYVQSIMGESFCSVLRDLKAKRLVLFSGTPCQIAGLKLYLGKDYRNLILVDLLCHGVNSPSVYMDYLRWMEKLNHSKCVRIDFRNKRKYGWGSHVESLYFENGFSVDSIVFRRLFYSHYILRTSCYSCHFATQERVGDITIGDCWGIEKINPGFFSKKGVSFFSINSEKGFSIFKKVKDEFESIEVCISDVNQPSLAIPVTKPLKRDLFWKKYKKLRFGRIAKRYAYDTVFHFLFGYIRFKKEKYE